ncbi:MAG TPA: endolytic transglycosylase MltG [Patescibacteria group bacterium]|nr:endolytic transglycosylase MltG [Patescibacteria group bacterium]
MSNHEFFIDQPRRSWFKIISLIISLGLVVLLTLGAYFYTKINQAASSVSVPVDIVINPGESTYAIAHKLRDEKVIGSYWSFVFYTKLRHASDKIQAGNYALDRDMNVVQIVDVLTVGKVVSTERKVTVVEGKTNGQIASDLEKLNVVSAEDFETALDSSGYNFSDSTTAQNFNYQGFLFPDTYLVSKDTTAQDLVQKMLSNFDSKITAQMRSDMEEQHRSLGDVVVLASIIEKEVGRNKTVITTDDQAAMHQERELVASVFYNRLAIGMPLESDATVNYITGKSTPSVSLEDTKIKSPYNTYQVTGLPPGPISNPGLDSIMAAIYPAQSDYLYFLNAPDGTAYFAKTLAEQNANKQKYLK